MLAPATDIARTVGDIACARRQVLLRPKPVLATWVGASASYVGWPVLVTIEYRLDPERAGEFVAVMHEMEIVRRRDGAIEWGVYQDIADPRRWLETFVVESWLEHLRQHQRITASDRALQALVYELLDGEPTISHLITRDGE